MLSLKALKELHSLSLSSHSKTDAASQAEPSRVLTCPVCHVACDDSPAARVVLHGDEAEVEAARKAMDEEVTRRKEGKKKGKNGIRAQQHGLVSNGEPITAAVKVVGMDAAHPGTKSTCEEGSKKGASPPAGRDKKAGEDEREKGRDGEATRKRVGVGIHLHQGLDDGKGDSRGGRNVIGRAEEVLVAKKRKNEESGSGSSDTKRQQQQQQQAHRPKGSDLVRVEQKWKAGEHVPDGATTAVYKSIFTSSSANQQKETYSCRSLPLGRF